MCIRDSINFDETREGISKNIETRKKAINYLINGGCVGIFPGGTVSTSLNHSEKLWILVGESLQQD